MSSTFVESAFTKEDLPFEVPLRPQSLDDFAGQEAVRERLQIMINAAKDRGEPLGHCLFCGPPGLGKTTLANILAKAMGTQLYVTSGPVLDKKGDLAGTLTQLKEGDIFFIDELHRLNRVVEESLYPAMEDFVLDLLLDSGPNARSVQVPLKKFTLVGATTRVGLLSAPMRTRFAFTTRLDYYEPEVLQGIILRSASLLQVKMTPEGAYEIARRCRGTPRIANNLLRWVRDFAHSRSAAVVDRTIASQALEMLAIDAEGLDELDIKILQTLIQHDGGRPIGLNTLSVAVGEESHTIEEVYEPYLIMKGFLKRTPRGREATLLAHRHLGLSKT